MDTFSEELTKVRVVLALPDLLLALGGDMLSKVLIAILLLELANEGRVPVVLKELLEYIEREQVTPLIDRKRVEILTKVLKQLQDPCSNASAHWIYILPRL